MATLEFQQKLLQLQKHLYHFAFRLTSNADNAHDLLQETNLKALNYCDRFECDTNFKAWIFTIMKNTFINNYRRRINLIITNGFDGLPKLNQIEFVVSLDPASMLESKQLEKIVESIDEKLKIPFKMKNEGFKYKEIAEKLDIKLGTVKSRIFIARKTLMKHLNENIMVFE